jgi:hypothetical protein
MKKDGTSQFMPVTQILSVTFDHPMLFDVYAPVDKHGNETFSTNAVMIKYKKLLSNVRFSHGQVLIWQPMAGMMIYTCMYCVSKRRICQKNQK